MLVYLLELCNENYFGPDQYLHLCIYWCILDCLATIYIFSMYFLHICLLQTTCFHVLFQLQSNFWSVTGWGYDQWLCRLYVALLKTVHNTRKYSSIGTKGKLLLKLNYISSLVSTLSSLQMRKKTFRCIYCGKLNDGPVFPYVRCMIR